MELNTAPFGTVIVIGHPGNGVTATRRVDGIWYDNLTHEAVFPDPRDVTDCIFIGPGGPRNGS